MPATDAPTTLAASVEAIRRSTLPSDELIVVDAPARSGPAAARNAGARRASGDVLVFVDADVVVHADALARLRAWFDRDDSLAAVFGSYDDAPAADGVVSSFRNLLHHHVHQESAGAVRSFWAGLGAIRRVRFQEIGGFDEARYPRPSVEDIDLGVRLALAGGRTVLDAAVLGTHLKHWSFVDMVRTDLLNRGIPWVELMVRHRRIAGDLNLSWRHRASALAVAVAVVGAASGRRTTALLATGAFVAVNGPFYAMLWRRRGPLEAGAGVALHAVHHAVGLTAVPLALARETRRYVVNARDVDRAAQS